MKVTRRDLLVWSAGAAAGLMVTPVPWKLLDDTSIWSQNWPWIPQPARGPVEVKHVGLHAVSERMRDESKDGGGMAGGRRGSEQSSRQPRSAVPARLRSASTELASAAVADGSSRGGCFYLGRSADGFCQGMQRRAGRGHRRISGTRGFVGVPELRSKARRASYRVVLGSETRALTPYESWSGVPASALGYDLENARTIVSFGAPLLDGWGTPGRFTRLWAERAAGTADPQLRLIQVESSLSRTAARAWQWVPVPAGAGVRSGRGPGARAS